MPVSEKTTLFLGTETARTDSQYHGAQVFAEYVLDKTDGAINIRLFPDSALGGTASLLAQVRAGSLDIMLSGSGNYAIPALKVFDLPFLFRDYEHVDKVMDGPIGRAVMDSAEAQNYKGLALWENGFRVIANSRNPVRLPDDVRDLKIRLPEMPMHIETWRLLGANPIPMNYTEVFTALDAAIIDAQDHPVPTLFSSRFYEMQKFLSISHHAYTPLLLVMNLKRFESFALEEQEIILEGARLGALAQRQFAREHMDGYIGQMRESGLEIIRAEEMDMAPWKEKILPGMIAFLEKIPEAIQWLGPIQDTR